MQTVTLTVNADSLMQALKDLEKSVSDSYTSRFSPYTNEPRWAFTPPTPPESATPQDQLIEQIKQLNASCQDLSGVRDNIDRLERENKAALIKDLTGYANLEIRHGPQGKRFLLAFWHQGEADFVEGIDYAFGKEIPEDEVIDQWRVRVQSAAHPIVDEDYYTMDSLHKDLDDHNIAHVVVYFDK